MRGVACRASESWRSARPITLAEVDRLQGRGAIPHWISLRGPEFGGGGGRGRKFPPQWARGMLSIGLGKGDVPLSLKSCRWPEQRISQVCLGRRAGTVRVAHCPWAFSPRSLGLVFPARWPGLVSFRSSTINAASSSRLRANSGLLYPPSNLVILSEAKNPCICTFLWRGFGYTNRAFALAIINLNPPSFAAIGMTKFWSRQSPR